MVLHAITPKPAYDLGWIRSTIENQNSMKENTNSFRHKTKTFKHHLTTYHRNLLALNTSTFNSRYNAFSFQYQRDYLYSLPTTPYVIQAATTKDSFSWGSSQKMPTHIIWWKSYERYREQKNLWVNRISNTRQSNAHNVFVGRSCFPAMMEHCNTEPSNQHNKKTFSLRGCFDRNKLEHFRRHYQSCTDHCEQTALINKSIAFLGK